LNSLVFLAIGIKGLDLRAEAIQNTKLNAENP